MGLLNLREQVIDELGRKIVTGAIPEGELLTTEQRLVEAYGVSRPVIREALKALATRGLIVSRAKIGTRVTPRDQWDLLDPSVMKWMVEASDPSPSFLLQLAQLRLILEPTTAAWVAQYAGSEARSRIGTAFAALEAAIGHEEQWAHADLHFHRAIIHASGNELLKAFERSLEPALIRSRIWTIGLLSALGRSEALPLEMSTHEALERHRAVWTAIQQRDGDAAQRAMTFLLQGVVELLRYVVEADEAPPADDAAM